jgi:plastocyanin
MRHTTFGWLISCAVAAFAAQACGGSSDSTGAPKPVIAKAASASGDGQTGQVGTALANPLRVLVTLSGNPKQGESVAWAAAGTGASVNPTSSVTDASGIATTAWTLGSVAGSQSATATLAGATGSPQTFTATASAAPVPLIQMTSTASGEAQSDTVGATLASPLRVVVTLSGTPQQGTTVTWSAAGTGAGVNPTTSQTDASGIATTAWTLGQAAGSQTATASLAGASGSPVTFHATAGAGAPTQLSLSSGDNQTGAPNTAGAALKVKVGDRVGNGVAGTLVDWAVTGGTAGVNPASSSSDATGIAQTALSFGATPGPVTVTATSGTLTGSPVTFHATVAPAAGGVSVQVGDFFFKSVRNNTQNPAIDTVAVGGTVTWTWVGAASHSVQSLGSPSFTSSTIKTSGTYSFTFNTAGSYTYDCAVHGAAMTGVIIVQ